MLTENPKIKILFVKNVVMNETILGVCVADDEHLKNVKYF